MIFGSLAVGVLGFLRIDRLVFSKKESGIDCKLEECSQNARGKKTLIGVLKPNPGVESTRKKIH